MQNFEADWFPVVVDIHIHGFREFHGLRDGIGRKLINNGWAEDADNGDQLYDAELKEATAFALRHDLGVWGLCGGFQIDLADEPAAPAQEAPRNEAPDVSVPEPEPEPATGAAIPTTIPVFPFRPLTSIAEISVAVFASLAATLTGSTAMTTTAWLRELPTF